MRLHITKTALCITVAFNVVTSDAVAGDLSPAPGPVAPTMKKLSEVEPRIAVNAANTPGDADSLFKITQPGSYYLSGNIIIKHTCSGNTTNWDIVANNVYGPIIDRTAQASPAVLGNSAADSTGSTRTPTRTLRISRKEDLSCFRRVF